MLSLGSAWVPGANQRILMPVICSSPKTMVLQSSRELGGILQTPLLTSDEPVFKLLKFSVPQQ